MWGCYFEGYYLRDYCFELLGLIGDGSYDDRVLRGFVGVGVDGFEGINGDDGGREVEFMGMFKMWGLMLDILKIFD